VRYCFHNPSFPKVGTLVVWEHTRWYNEWISFITCYFQKVHCSPYFENIKFWIVIPQLSFGHLIYTHFLLFTHKHKLTHFLLFRHTHTHTHTQTHTHTHTQMSSHNPFHPQFLCTILSIFNRGHETPTKTGMFAHNCIYCMSPHTHTAFTQHCRAPPRTTLQ
jgi:hypothetical protein